MKKITILSLAIMLIMVTGSAAAYNFSARSFGMGGAFTGLADDVSAVLYNPAGVNQSGLVGLKATGGLSTTDYSKFSDVMDIEGHMDDDSMNYDKLYKEFPDGADLQGQGFIGLNLKSLALSTNVENHFSLSKDSTTASITNDAMVEGALTMGNKILTPPMNIGAISYGANLKMIKLRYDEYSVDKDKTNPQKTEITANGDSYGLDVGLLAKITDMVTLGAQVDNLWVDDYKLEGTEKNYKYNQDPNNPGWKEPTSSSYTEKGDRLKRTMRVGASVQIPVLAATVAADIDNFPLFTEGDRDMIYHLGIEKNILFNGISLRAGTYTDPDDDNFYTAGIGLNLWKIHMDLGVGSNDGFNDSITGVLSGNIKF